MAKIVFLGLKVRYKNTGVGKYCQDLAHMLSMHNLDVNFRYVTDSKTKTLRFIINYFVYPLSCLFLSNEKNVRYIIVDESCAFLSLFLARKNYSLIVHDLRNLNLYRQKLSTLKDYLSYLQVKLFFNIKDYIVPSCFTKKQLEGLRGTVNVCHVPNVFNDNNALLNDELPKNEYLNKRYCLYVGSSEPRKNFDTIKSVGDVLYNKHGILLYVVGINCDLPCDSIRFFRGISETDLNALYRNAICLINASVFEGFGRVVIEAQSNQCPVVSSKCAALAEVLGDSAVIVDDPYDVDSFVGAVELLLDETIRKRFISIGLINFYRYLKSDKQVDCLVRAINKVN